MFGITVFVAANVQPIVLLYKNEEAQKTWLDKINSFDSMVLGTGTRSPWALIEDDFGQKLNLIAAPLAVLAQDMTLAREADILRGVFNAITQAKAQDRAKTDPFLAQHMRQMQQGPAVHMPFGMPTARN